MKVAIVGAGHIGRHIAVLLVKTGDYAVTIFDNDHKNLSLIDDPYGRITPKNLNILNEAEACASIRGHDIMINALPFHAATRAADIALLTDCHYFDLTEDI